MALSRSKTWIAGETLTAADLNAEFNNIIDNAASLVSPLTGNLDANGNVLILDADGDTTITADTDDRLDFALSGTDLFRMDGTATTPVNGLTLIARATGSKPSLQALTSDANEGLDIRDDNGNEILILSSVASAANEITITAAAAGSEPSIAATGDDTDIDITLTPKGTGGVTVSTGDVTVSDGDLTVTSTDAGASSGPLLVLDRNSASPTANDVLGNIPFRGRNSSAATIAYATLRAQILDATASSEDGVLQVFTYVAGSVSNRLNIGHGLYTPNATGGDQGADTINVSTYYKDGAELISGGLVLLASASPSAASSVDITSAITSTYKTYLLVFENLIPSAGSADLWLRTSTDNSTFDSGASDYAYAGGGVAADLGGAQYGSTGDSKILMNEDSINGAAGAGGVSGRVWISDPLDSAIDTRVQFETYFRAGAGVVVGAARGVGRRAAAEDVDAVQIRFSSGNITSGEVRFYGVINS